MLQNGRFVVTQIPQDATKRSFGRYLRTQVRGKRSFYVILCFQDDENRSICRNLRSQDTTNRYFCLILRFKDKGI